MGSLRGKDGEGVNMAVKGHLDNCCLQETRWRGEGTRKMGAYKLFWIGCEKGIHGGVHQGSVLSPLLFIIVLEALYREFREGLPMELLYADDLVLMADSEDMLMEKLRKWKTGMEAKGLRVKGLEGSQRVLECW